MVKNVLLDMYKGKRVLVTGHTGFKGAWLSAWLVDLGAEVTGYALEPPTNPSIFEACGLDEKMTSVISDIRDFRKLNNVFNEYSPEIVFHMAAQALVRDGYSNPVYTYETNVMGTVNVLEACRCASSVRAVINVTSDKCYENRECEYAYKEEDSMGGYDPYSSSKGCSELVTSAYLRSYFSGCGTAETSASLASARSGNVIGGGDWSTDRLVPDCIKALCEGKPLVLRSPKAVRPWQHVLEPLYGYLLLGCKLNGEKEKYSGAWNFGPDPNDVYSVQDVAERIKDIWGDGIGKWKLDKGVNLHEARLLTLDSSKAAEGLGWGSIWGLDMALSKTVEWYKAYFEREDMFSLTIKQIHEYEGGKDGR